LSRVELAAAMALGSEAQQGLAWARKAWSRYVSKPVRWAATASGVAWVWGTGWGVGDALWSLLDQPLDKRYRRPEAELLRQAASWLEQRQKRHHAAAARAALLATLASGGRMGQGHAALLLLTKAVPGMQPLDAGTPQSGAAGSGRGLPDQALQAWAFLDWSSLVGMFNSRKPVNGDSVEVVAAAYAALEASRIGRVSAPCGWTDSATAGGRILRTGCGVSQRALLPLMLLGREPGGLAAGFLGGTALSRPQQLAASAYERLHPASTSAAPTSGLRVVDWDGRQAAAAWGEESRACGMEQKEGHTLTAAQSERCASFLQRVAMRPDAESREFWWEAGALAPWHSLGPQYNTTNTAQRSQIPDPTRIAWHPASGGGRGVWLVSEANTPSAQLHEWLPLPNTTLARFLAVDTAALPASCRGSGAVSLTGWEAHVQFRCGMDSSELLPREVAGVTPRGVCILSFTAVSVIACS
jgi:hypothetical protein